MDSNFDIRNITQPNQTNGRGEYEIVIGCILAILGNLIISVSLNLQKFTHERISKAGSSARHYTCWPVWWVGLFLMILGEVGNFSAYGFAPASLVAPLGTTTVIANMVIAVTFLKEKLRSRDLFGSVLAIIGAVILINFSNKQSADLNARGIMQSVLHITFIVYSLIEIVALIVLFILEYRYKIKHVIVPLLIASILASFTVISAKGLSSMIQFSFEKELQLKYPIFWVMLVVMAVTALIQVKFINIAMQRHNSTVVVPTNFVLFTISAIISGIIFYQEFNGLRPLGIFLFFFGCLLCFIGVYLITSGRPNKEAKEEKYTDSEESFGFVEKHDDKYWYDDNCIEVSKVQEKCKIKSREVSAEKGLLSSTVTVQTQSK